MPQDYIGVNILQALQRILESWVLPKKNFGVMGFAKEQISLITTHKIVQQLKF